MFFRLGDFASVPDDLLGELTVLLGPPCQKPRLAEEALLKLAREVRGAEAKADRPRSLAKKLHDLVYGWSVDEIYAFLQKNK
jgi:16S rRNA (cytidine1402-2'-O)-methyltransferase